VEELAGLEISGVTVLNHGCNLGISEAVNGAVAFAREEGYKTAILFDQDSRLEPEMFSVLLRDYLAISAVRQIACIGPTVHVRGHRIQVPRWSRRGRASIFNCLEVYHVITSGMLVNVAAFGEIGGFDSRFPIDFSDFSFCWRAIDHGFQVFQSREAVMNHEIGNGGFQIGHSTVHLHAYYRHYFMVRDTLNAVLKNRETPFSVRVRFLYQLPIRALLFAMILPDKKRRGEMYWAGLRDFVKGIRGFGSVASLLGARK